MHNMTAMRNNNPISAIPATIHPDNGLLVSTSGYCAGGNAFELEDNVNAFGA